MTDNNLISLDYFCDNTMKRFIEVVIRAFSGFQYVSTTGGVTTYNTVACMPAQTSQLVAQLNSNGSENSMPVLPMISVTHTGLELRPQDLQNPAHVDRRTAVEREIVNGQYTGRQGRAYTVERMMPRPFTMRFNVDIWVSNQDQKYQLMEQILTIFYPSINIQNSENALDWGAISRLKLTGVNWASKPMPVGTNTSDIDFATLNFELPIWLSPPARVKQRQRIEQIVTNVINGHNNHGFIEGIPIEQVITTPGNHFIHVEKGEITLLSEHAGLYDVKGQVYDWASLVTLYGNLRPGTSTIRLSTTEDIEDTTTDVVGTLAYDPNAVNKMIWTVDPTSLPATTLANINGIVDPDRVYPGMGLAEQTIGQRYLLAKDIGTPTLAWGSVTAKTNDIIQFDGSQWTVVYHPTLTGAKDIVLNTNSGSQLKWFGDKWGYIYGGEYPPGYWRLHI